MADPTDTDEDHTESSVIKDLRSKAKRAEEAEARAEAAERKLAFSDAGLTGLNEKQQKALLATHDGEVTAESLRATADELGFGAKPTTEETPAAEVETPDRDAEVAELGKLAGSPVNTDAPAKGQAAVVKEIEDFQGDFQAFQAFVMQNADRILD